MRLHDQLDFLQLLNQAAVQLLARGSKFIPLDPIQRETLPRIEPITS